MAKVGKARARKIIESLSAPSGASHGSLAEAAAKLAREASTDESQFTSAGPAILHKGRVVMTLTGMKPWDKKPEIMIYRFTTGSGSGGEASKGFVFKELRMYRNGLLGKAKSAARKLMIKPTKGTAARATRATKIDHDLELLRSAERGEILDADDLCRLVKKGYINQAKASKMSSDAYSKIEQRNGSRTQSAAAEAIREVAAINYRDGMALEKTAEATLRRLKRFPIERDIMAVGVKEAIAIYNKEMRRLLLQGAENRRAAASGQRNAKPTRNLSRFTNARSKAWGD